MKRSLCCSEANGIQHKIAGIIIQNRKFLAVRKENKKEFIIPGGGHETGETHEDTLRRELKEELLVNLLNYSPLGVFRNKAIWTNQPLLAHIYFVEISGVPCPSSEIVEYQWLDKNFKQKGLEVGSILEFSVVPKLIKQGLM